MWKWEVMVFGCTPIISYLFAHHEQVEDVRNYYLISRNYYLIIIYLLKVVTLLKVTIRGKIIYLPLM